MIDPENCTLAQMASAFRQGRLDPRVVAEACVNAHQLHGERLQAYKTWDESGLRKGADIAARAFARGQDSGPLQGIPCSVKDLYGVPGLPTFAGTPRALPDRWQTPGPVVSSLLKQQACISGKTHTVEFAYGGLGTNPHWGTPRNPWDSQQHRVPGGSSSGAGVSLIESSARLALGTDTAGSVRIPASMTGTVGLKLTKDRWSTEGIVPLSTSFDTPGVLSRTVKDMVWAFNALDQESVDDAQSARDMRIGIPDVFFWDDCDEGITDCVEQALKELETAGASLQNMNLERTDDAFNYFRKGGLTPPELYAFLHDTLPEWLDCMDASVRQRMEAGKDIPAWEYVQRRSDLLSIGSAAAQQLRSINVMVVPTVATSAPALTAIAEPAAYAAFNIKALRNTCIANLLGLCSLTIPVGLDNNGIPVGMMLMAGPGQELELLRCALGMETVLGDARSRLGKPSN